LAIKFLVVDTTTGERSLQTSTLLITDQDYDVTNPSGQTDFVTTYDFENSNYIDVFVNGIKQREGGGHDYTRNAATNTITFTYTIPQNAWVQIRIY
jgi:DNA gyrase/topoisomerase IV subunit B